MGANLTDLVDDALEELRAWQASEPDGVKRSGPFYGDLAARLLRLKAAHTVDAADWLYNDLMRRLLESGPLGGDFLPSLERISARIGDLHKR